MSLAKLTSISTQTLSLLLERQRLQTLPSYSSQTTGPSPPQPNNLHLAQITQNLNSLRSGILALEAKEGRSDAVTLLRNQHERMRGMLGAREDDGVERFVAAAVPCLLTSRLTDCGPSLEPQRPPVQLIPTPPPEPVYTPYTDDPDAEPAELLQTQRQMMDRPSLALAFPETLANLFIYFQSKTTTSTSSRTPSTGNGTSRCR